MNRYDVVVLDRDLPGLHGDAVCRKITEGTDPAMVLMLTAADAPVDRVTGLRLGADDYLPKPFNFDELVLRIRGLARRKPTAHVRLFRSAGVTLDPLQRVVTEMETDRDLSAKEFALLEALMRAAGSIVKRREASRTGVGRAQRPIHQDGPGHLRKASTEARGARHHRDHPRSWLPDREPALSQGRGPIA